MIDKYRFVKQNKDLDDFFLDDGAGCRIRTDDLRITSALLYQLS